MFHICLLVLAVASDAQPAPNQVKNGHSPQTVIKQVAESGRTLSVADNPDCRVDPRPQIAPGPPPTLSFRFYEGKLHHRFGNSELLLDDAGH